MVLSLRGAGTYVETRELDDSEPKSDPKDLAKGKKDQKTIKKDKSNKAKAGTAKVMKVMKAMKKRPSKKG